MTAHEAARQRQMNDDHNEMMARALLVYNRLPWAMGKGDLARWRVQISEQLVGQFWRGGRKP